VYFTRVFWIIPEAKIGDFLFFQGGIDLLEAEFMKRAMELAGKAEGWTSPNPMVGAVIVKNGRIVGEGFHQKAGTPHAEIHALKMAGREAAGADVYVTLEPCCHYGRTPPCTDALIQAGVARVVVAVTDPNPKVAGGGIKKLREAGIDVVLGMMEQEARLLNEVFFKYIRSPLPFVSVKSAMTLDGKTATKTGSSQWITGLEAREYVHRLRHKHDAVLTGIGTVLADDPQLTARIPGEQLKNPIRVMIDSELKIPLDARVLNTSAVPTLIYSTGRGKSEKAQALRKKGVEVINYAGREGKVDLLKVLQDLRCRGITSILVEGGAGINGALLDLRLIDKLYLFVALKLVGSSLAPGVFGGLGRAEIGDAVTVKNVSLEKVGADFIFTGYPVFV